jgi:hypothetical protein
MPQDGVAAATQQPFPGFYADAQGYLAIDFAWEPICGLSAEGKRFLDQLRALHYRKTKHPHPLNRGLYHVAAPDARTSRFLVRVRSVHQGFRFLDPGQ